MVQFVDREYLMTVNPYIGHDELRFEKKMLDDWFRKRFDAREVPGAR